MAPFVAFGLGLPDFYLLLPMATVLAGVLSLVIGFFVATYRRAAGGGLVLALIWMAVAVIYGVSVGTAVALAVAFVAIALVAHMLRRLRRA